ncbi:MAG: hypothetical protein IPM26_00945 [Saprospiraceae bacterium]|nr:hypothetical protein [Saprospiraceae bacterium]
MVTSKDTNLTREFYQNLPALTKPVTDFIALFVLSILKTGTVNVLKGAIRMSTDADTHSNFSNACTRCEFVYIRMSTDADTHSNYRKIQRFMDQVR